MLIPEPGVFRVRAPGEEGMRGRGWGRRQWEEGAGKVAHGAWVPGWGG